MIIDVEAERVNCIIVKDLSRFGRDYIEAGRYIQKIFPALGVRFIALNDHYDSVSADVSESSIVLPVKNFINDSYCRDISTKVKSQFEIKRKNGECIAPFALYGYQKDSVNKNILTIDEYAAENVKMIFRWKVEGYAVSAIAKRLNELGILSPKEYKKSRGNYRGGFSGAAKSNWSSATVKRILNNETYLGHMIQGKTERINYKVKKSIMKSEAEWIRVENTHEAIISPDTFAVVQNLMKTDGRISPVTGKKSNSCLYGYFTGLLFCGDCGEQMIRRVNRYKDREKVYYICSTKNRGDGCSRHSILEDAIKAIVNDTVKCYANTFLNEALFVQKVKETETNFAGLERHNAEIERLKQEQDKYKRLLTGLSDDLKEGVITQEEFGRLYKEFERKSAEYEEAQKKQELLIQELFRSGAFSASRLEIMRRGLGLTDLERHTLCRLVKRVLIFENGCIEIECCFQDQYQIRSS